MVDSHSTDATREIAARHGARVIERDWPGYRSQKQFATDAAANDWVLSVDADERVTPALRAQIEALRAGGFAGARGWSIPRLTEYFGRFLRHGNCWPDRQIRLYDRRAARWVGYEVHEKIAVDGAVGTLRAPLEHYAYRNLDDHLARLDRYAGLMAAQMHAAGRKRRVVAGADQSGLALPARHVHQARRAGWLARLAVPHRRSRLRAPQVPAPVGAVARASISGRSE